jgi:hypothetical protein
MDTQLPPPNDSPAPRPRRVRSLAKLAAGFASLFFAGLAACAYSVRHSIDEFGGIPGNASFFVMLFAILGLLATGIAALVRIIRRRYKKINII